MKYLPIWNGLSNFEHSFSLRYKDLPLVSSSHCHLRWVKDNYVICEKNGGIGIVRAFKKNCIQVEHWSAKPQSSAIQLVKWCTKALSNLTSPGFPFDRKLRVFHIQCLAIPPSTYILFSSILGHKTWTVETPRMVVPKSVWQDYSSNSPIMLWIVTKWIIRFRHVFENVFTWRFRG